MITATRRDQLVDESLSPSPVLPVVPGDGGSTELHDDLIVDKQLCSSALCPWFEHAATYPSAVLRVDCDHLGIDNSIDSTLVETLELFDNRMLAKVTFLHCPRLDIPPIIKKFTALQGVFIVHSSLVSWPVEATVTQHSNPMLVFVFILNTNLSARPTGLYHQNLPHGQSILELMHTNLTQLPVDVGDVWATQHWMHLGFYVTPLASLPASFAKLQLDARLSLTSTALTSLNGELIRSHRRLRKPYLSGQALTWLDTDAGALPSLHALYLEHTNVSTPPDWMRDWWSHREMMPTAILSLFGSPYCEEKEAEPAWCATDHGTRDGFYEYEQFKRQYGTQ